MKNLKFLILTIGVIAPLSIINSNVPATESSTSLAEQPETLKKATGSVISGAETLATEALTHVESDLASYFEERVKKSPFKASVKPGVCLFGGLANQEYRFPECEGEIGDSLKECCSKKTKADVNASKAISSMATPDWMKDNPEFSTAGSFFATPVVTTKKSK